MLLSGLCLVFVFHAVFLVSSLDGTVPGVMSIVFSCKTFEKAGAFKVIGLNWNQMVELGHSDFKHWAEPFGVVINCPLSIYFFHSKLYRNKYCTSYKRDKV